MIRADLSPQQIQQAQQLVLQHLDALYKAFGRALKKLPRLVRIRHKDELFSAAVDGYYDAAFHFDPSRGVRFTTYMTPRVWGSMKNALKPRHKLNDLLIPYQPHHGASTPTTTLAESKELWELLKGILTDREYTVLTLYFREGKSLQDIAAHLQRSYRMTHYTYHTALRQVAPHLRRLGYTPFD